MTPSQPQPPTPLSELEDRILFYKFNDKKLLEEALTHPSYGAEYSYERLEYIGDSVLNTVITKEQYVMYPDLPQGPLTRLRAANVDTEKLARVAVKHGLYRYLRHKKALLDKQIEEFMVEIEKYPLHSNGLVDPPKDLADIVESTIGAVFIDSSFSLDTVWKVFKRILEPLISPETLGTHPMTLLYEMCQKKGWTVKMVDHWKDNNRYDVFIEGHLMGHAVYPLKKEIAQNRAAKDALDHIHLVIKHGHDINGFCMNGIIKTNHDSGDGHGDGVSPLIKEIAQDGAADGALDHIHDVVVHGNDIHGLNIDGADHDDGNRHGDGHGCVSPLEEIAQDRVAKDVSDHIHDVFMDINGLSVNGVKTNHDHGDGHGHGVSPHK